MEDGCGVYGLYLEGAKFDTKEGILAESKPKELYSGINLPHIFSINYMYYIYKIYWKKYLRTNCMAVINFFFISTENELNLKLKYCKGKKGIFPLVVNFLQT